jgi:DNA polymerase/3'-5' exonuclease PolX
MKKLTIKHTSRTNSSNNKHNSNIIHILTLVKDYYKEQNDKFRIKTYERAIYQVRKWDKPITKGSEISHLEGIGKGMIEKIDTIISSGTLPIIKEKHIVDKYNKYTKNTKKNNQKYNYNDEVNKILGFNKIFINNIKKKHGARTINDFRKVFNNSGSRSGRSGRSSDNKTDLKLTHIQQLGLNYYEDLQDLIPRDEITYLGNLLKKEIEHNDNSNKYTMLLSGSYPSHSKEYSKDIDIIIVRNKEESYSGELKDIIEKIGNDKNNDKYKDNHNDKNNMTLETISLGEKKFMGLLHSNKSNKMRHIDIRFVNLEELPYTWLYYSSGQIFNKLIRDKLKKKGYKLNEYGLYKGDGKEKKYNKYNKYNKYDKVNIDMNLEYDLLSYIENVEKQIFKIADMEYKTVKERY